MSDVTGFPEMMDGRVKTLHPAMFAGILARRNRPDDLAALGAQGISPVDLVVVNLYPFGTAADNPATPFDALVEEIDIGGPSLLRAAAKNFRDVLVVVHPEDYPKVLEELARAGGPSLEFRFELMKKAFMHTGQYDGMIAMTMAHVDVDGGAMTRKPLKRPTRPFTAARARCATARTRIRAPPGSSSRRTPGGAGRSTRARSSRTRTCSTSMPRCAFPSSSASRRQW